MGLYRSGVFIWRAIVADTMARMVRDDVVLGIFSTCTYKWDVDVQNTCELIT